MALAMILGLGTVALALIVFGLGLECSGLVNITVENHAIRSVPKRMEVSVQPTIDTSVTLSPRINS